MPVEPGTRLGLYKVTAAIGAGGLGEVWRAHDPPPALMFRWVLGVSGASATCAAEHH